MAASRTIERLRSSGASRALLFAGLLQGACAEGRFPDDGTTTEEPASASATITVMTRNLYLGARAREFVSASSPDELPGLVSAAWAQVLANDFPARAELLADEIAATAPDLIGLQEVALFRVERPGDSLTDLAPDATEVAADYLEILEAALRARGLDYRVVQVSPNADLEAPDAAGDDLRLTDRDVILARADVTVTRAASRPFASVFDQASGIPGAPPLRVRRGWAAVNAVVAGRAIRFAVTHLEPLSESVRELQAAELVAALEEEGLPVLLAGDLNDAPGGRIVAAFAATGLEDAWARARGSASGPTCCQARDLQNVTSTLGARIDYVLARGDPAGAWDLGTTSAQLVGDDPTLRTPAGLWPSLHAGVVVRFRPHDR